MSRTSCQCGGIFPWRHVIYTDRRQFLSDVIHRKMIKQISVHTHTGRVRFPVNLEVH